MLTTNSTPFTEFTNPEPELGTGVHRFLSAIYVQPERFNTEGFETAMSRQVSNWSVSTLVYSFDFGNSFRRENETISYNTGCHTTQGNITGMGLPAYAGYNIIIC